MTSCIMIKIYICKEREREREKKKRKSSCRLLPSSILFKDKQCKYTSDVSSIYFAYGLYINICKNRFDHSIHIDLIVTIFLFFFFE